MSRMELWDAYTRDGVLTGETLIRGEEIPAGRYHIVCEVMARHRDGTFLAMKRSASKLTYPGFWEVTAGGSALQGEDRWQCVRRELKEETGVDGENFVQIAENIYDEEGCIFVTFTCTVDCDKDTVLLQEGETEDFKWMTEEELIDWIHSGEMIAGQRERYRDYFIQMGYSKPEGEIHMDMKQFLAIPGEKPLDRIVDDGGYCAIFRTIGCVGDSLSSGEFESLTEDGKKGYHDYYEYSWGQYIARATGATVYNFSRGGMTAQEYMESFAESRDFWNEDKLCQAYIFALGVNDLFGRKQPVGSVEDIDREHPENNAETFAGWYARIIQRLKKMQPKAKFFLMTMPKSGDDEEERAALKKAHAKLLYDLAEFFDYTYVLDFNQYAPDYDPAFRKNFYLGGHLNPMGYLLTGKMVSSYIDYIVRNNMEDFAQVGFIGKGGVHNCQAKW